MFAYKTKVAAAIFSLASLVVNPVFSEQIEEVNDSVKPTVSQLRNPCDGIKDIMQRDLCELGMVIDNCVKKGTKAIVLYDSKNPETGSDVLNVSCVPDEVSKSINNGELTYVVQGYPQEFKVK